MATITGLTADRMLAIEAASVVDGDIVGDNLFLEKHDGSLINAGNVRGPAGPTGPMGSALHVISAVAVSDVGTINQIRAGRQLTAADFTNMGLVAPLGLWNLSSFNDASGNGRTLNNKGSVPLGVGINGLASTAAAFAGSTAQALYIADTGAADPFRIRTGSVGCWMRTAKQGVTQRLVTKSTPAAGGFSWFLSIDTTNMPQWSTSADGSTQTATNGITNLCDDRWHFVVGVCDGYRNRIYVDGVQEAVTYTNGPIAVAAGPLNIGSRSADGSAAAVEPHYGRVDEAFVTSDALNEDEIRNLYASSISHALGSTPSAISVSVHRKRRGGAAATTDFPSQPARLHNFTGGALTDQGANNVPLVWTPGANPIVAGVDGSRDGAVQIGANNLMSADTGLPAGLIARSYGLWIRSISAVSAGIFGWGTVSSADARIWINAGQIQAASGTDNIVGPWMLDGEWHHIVMVEDNAPADGVKRKLYWEGRCILGSTVLNNLVLAGANRFRVGANPDGTAPWTGYADGAFVFPGALTSDQVRTLYNVGSQALAASPKNAADHIEALEAGRILGIFDTIEPTDSLTVAVAA